MPILHSRRPLVATLAFAGLLAAVAGCDLLKTTEPHGYQPALILIGSDTAPIVAPDTVDPNVPFTVTISTFGGGCTREAERTDYGVNDSLVAIAPYDRWRGSECPADQVAIDHTVSVTVPHSGDYTLRFFGRSFSTDSGTTDLVNIDLPLHAR